MNQDIVLTTGIYDLIKDLLRRKKVTPFVEDQLIVQLKRAKQIRRRELPDNVVTIDCRVTIKDLNTNELQTFTFVAPSKAKRRNNTESIVGEVGLALVGNKIGDQIKWDFGTGEKNIEIVNVEKFQNKQ
ncbi:GreA/GreB family elongation factor [Flavobacterium sediminilitoris]|uniref:GreA/GreB family elongation factor n=1 Tax=Flavobacterium sediminilitoris TaxID=2024526 RepID=A0ABY4HKD3_9FLAO|nr:MULTISPECIES: GreA/GreB family elongation factor [Flavobacterium]UOX32662.1 GreA/GreB family elongation factor [Flavobacterium sediminilitoris]